MWGGGSAWKVLDSRLAGPASPEQSALMSEMAQGAKQDTVQGRRGWDSHGVWGPGGSRDLSVEPARWGQ